ncbi:MAG: sigma-70 family RNA polymerase sigma factor [Clostridiales bacterium]|nr:sigma-70 family RNA polymerase sigma factor [Clostridiales bacterium]
MSNETLAAKAKQGDQGALLRLWEGVQRFAYREANRWARAWPRAEIDDLEQAAFLGLMAAVDSYDPERGHNFLTWYGNYWLKTAFSYTLGVNSSKRDMLDYSVSLDAPLDDGDAESDTISDTVPAPGNDIEAAEERIYREQLHETMGKEISERLTEAERAVITGVYLEGKTRQQAGLMCGLTNDQTRRVEQRALASLRKSRALKGYIDDRIDLYWSRGIHCTENTVVLKEKLADEFNERFYPYS